MQELRGIISAFVTPMHSNEEINEAELKNQVERQIAAGAAAVFCGGTNGEGYALSFEEKLRITALTAEAARGRVPVLSGTGCVTTRETVALSRAAAENGADAVSVVLPYFAAASQDELYAHYMAVADAVDVPVLIYNIPARTGNCIEPETVARLAEHPNIYGIKDSSGDFARVRSYIAIGDEKIHVYCGTDSLILASLREGAAGAISAVTNILPEMVYSIYRGFVSGDFAAAQAAQEGIQPIRDCFKLGNPNTVVKRAVEQMGYPVGKPRRPFCGLSAAADVAITDTIVRCYSQYVRR